VNLAKLTLDRDQARELYRKYQEHRAYQTPHDEAIAQIYRRIGRGQQVIRALESIRVAGLDSAGLPRLAIARADLTLVYWHTRTDAGAFADTRSYWPGMRHNRSKVIPIDWPGLKAIAGTHEAQVPLIPVHLRPRRGIANYHILFEAEWTRRYPIDPYLVRRFGADAWLIVAAWDLTEVERAVMASRLHA
jgi:hypothetical protein